MHTVLVGKPEGKRPLRRLICRLEGNIKMDPEEIRCKQKDWNHMAQVRDQWQAFVNTVMKLWVP
jgi:hypothetical protein